MIHITADSRKIQKGDIFVAIKGYSRDGHDFIPNAIERGASLIIAEEGEYSIPYQIVESSREYLVSYLKKEYNPLFQDMKFVGITGTNGKTTTAYLIYKALRKLGIKAAYIGTIGFYLDKKICSLPNTCPDVWDLYDMFLQAKEEGCTYVIQEISSDALARGRVEGYTFDYAIFTNLTQDHLDFHKTMGNYALAKQQLFKKLKPSGKAIVNVDDKYKDYFLLPENNTITYGFTDGKYRVKSFQMEGAGTEFIFEHEEESYEIYSKLIGKYNVYNMFVTVLFLDTIGIPFEDIQKVVRNLEAPSGRMELIPYRNNHIIIDYAHTPDAVEKVIKAAIDITKGNIYVVFGCTGDRDRSKRPIMMHIVTNLSKRVIVTSDDPHYEDPDQIVSDMLEGLENKNYEVCLDRKKAIKKGILLLKENDTLLILGKGHEEFILYRDEKIPFNDKKVVLKYLESIMVR